MTIGHKYDRGEINLSRRRFAAAESSSEAVSRSLKQATGYLLKLQHPEGYWLGELEADSSLEADAILLDFYLGNPNMERVRKLANCIRDEQTQDGGWVLYPGGSPNINLIVKSHFSLQLAGMKDSDPALLKAAQLALELGGVEACNSFTRIYLCLFGQYDWNSVPAIPPEILLLPKSAYINIFEVSSWSRAILVPLTILYSYQPRRTPPQNLNIERLFLPDANPSRSLLPFQYGISWKTFFHATDIALRTIEQNRLTPLRRKALGVAEQWMRERMEGSDGLAAIYPAMMNAIMAMDCLGYSRRNDPLFQHELDEFWRFAIEERDSMRMQPCLSPVWDTAIALFCEAEGGLNPSHPELLKAADWLVSKQVLKSGDWEVKNPRGVPGGWSFEFSNDPFPDVDDTAMVLLALSRVRMKDVERQQESMRRGLEWLLSMQNSDGGWASFDKDNNKTILCKVPYADHNAMIDPSTADITGRVLEMLGSLGFGPDFEPARRAIQFVRDQQESDGAWFGRWGVNYIYGTCFVLRGLAAIGVDMHEAFCLRGAEWIRSFQNSDGGWGESCDSYDNPDLRGLGPSTAAQTSWALLGLFATGDFTSESVARGISYLLSTQNSNGTWEDSVFTGTGFPRVFYLKYHLYSVYFPILALSQYANRNSVGSAVVKPTLRNAGMW